MVAGLFAMLVSWCWRRSESLSLTLPAQKAAALAGFLRRHSSDDVGAAAGRVGDDHADRPRGIDLGLGRRRDRERGERARFHGTETHVRKLQDPKRCSPDGLARKDYRYTLFYCGRATLSIGDTAEKREVRTMKSILSLALLVGLGLSATAVQANDTSPSCGSSTFPATGQVTPATGTMTHTGATVRDDGFVKAGGALSYQDNLDGTVTDLNTGLMWEKKSMDGTDHDVSKTFVWSSAVTDTVWDWINAINTEVGNGIGFAGYNDWRLPNRKELESIVDAGNHLPAVDPVFNHDVSAGCTVLTCSATVSSFYWSATTAADDPFNAWFVDFFNGIVVNDSKGGTHFVRAVRGGCLPGG
jgi:hypothetical protein